MTLKKALSIKSLFLALGTVFLSGVIAWGFILIRAPLPLGTVSLGTLSQGTLSVFSAPSQLPAGEHWVLVGAFTELPEDLAANPLAGGVLVLERQKISSKAYGFRVQLPAAAPGKLLGVSSEAQGAKAELELYLGGVLPPLTADANFSEADFFDGQLVVDGPYFIYGYFAKSASPLAALRIFNRSTGRWQGHEQTAEKARLAAEPPAPASPEFQAVDPLVTLPDTDGDGIFDFEEAPEVRDPVPEQLGVELVPGTNLLDLVAADEAGNVSWKTLAVYTTYLGN